MAAKSPHEMGPNTRSFLGDLYEREFEPLKRQAYQIAADTPHKIDPSGAAVEALIKAALKREAFRGGSEAEFRGWLRAILANEVTDALRRAAARERSFPVGHPALDRAAAGDADVIRRDEVQALTRGLDRLSDEDRELLLLVYRDDLPQSVIAEMYGVSPEVIRQRVARARQRLGEQMGHGR